LHVAGILIHKNKLLRSNIKFLKNIFPEQKHIFKSLI